MRRAGHIRQRSPGSFELRYDLDTDPATGKRKTVTTTVRGSRKDAERELRRLLHAVDTGQHVDRTRMTVRRWLTLWLDTIQHEVAPRSLDPRPRPFASCQALGHPSSGAIQSTGGLRTS